MNRLDFTSFEVSDVCRKLVKASAQLMGDAGGWAWICEAINKSVYMLLELQRRNLSAKADIECYKEMIKHPEELASFEGAEQRMWVPVDAYLPEHGETVLVTKSGTNTPKHVVLGTFCESSKFGIGEEDVIAWCPRPEPWDEKRSSEDKQ